MKRHMHEVGLEIRKGRVDDEECEENQLDIDDGQDGDDDEGDVDMEVKREYIDDDQRRIDK